MNCPNDLGLVIKNLNISTGHKTISKTEFFENWYYIHICHFAHTGCRHSVSRWGRQRGAGVYLFHHHKNKAYEVLLLLLLPVCSAINSVVANTKSLKKASADGETIYSPQKTLRTSRRINKEYQQDFHTQELSPIANLPPGPKFTEMEKYPNTLNIDLCCLFWRGFNQTI